MVLNLHGINMKKEVVKITHMIKKHGTWAIIYLLFALDYFIASKPEKVHWGSNAPINQKQTLKTKHYGKPLLQHNYL